MGLIDFEKTVSAATYDPLPIVLREAKGRWVTDIAGPAYLDMMSAYSAVSLGHGHPRILRPWRSRRPPGGDEPGLPHGHPRRRSSRARRRAGLDMALPMNTGAEAVETAIKAARR